MSKTDKTGTLFGGILLGSTIGVAIGLLIAPRSGKDTRKVLKKSADALPQLAEDLSSTMHLQARRLSTSASHKWEHTLIRLQEAIAAGVEASQLVANQASTEAVDSVEENSFPSSKD